MAEVRLTIPDEIVGHWKAALGPGWALAEMVEEAMSLFNWAIIECANGRCILSATEDGRGIRQVSMNALDRARACTG